MSASESAEGRRVDLLAMLAERYPSPQARGSACERLMQRALQCHADVYGPQRFARITGTITSHVQTAVGADADLAGTFDRFAEQMQATVGGSLAAGDLAAIKIEEGYRERTGSYEPFSGIVLTDTFAHDPSALPDTGTLGYNSARARQQNELPIQVIIGNPPWSAGQKSAGDDNPNAEHPQIEQRVRDTYGHRHREVTGHSAGAAPLATSA